MGRLGFQAHGEVGDVACRDGDTELGLSLQL